MHHVAASPLIRDSLIDRLIENGLTRVVAEDLVGKFSPATIERQLKALPFRHPRNPAQCLQSSIRHEWAMPPEMVRAKMTTTGTSSDRQWYTVDGLASEIDAALAERDDRLMLEAYAVDAARRYFPNQIGMDGRDMDNMPRAVRMVLAFELGLFAELQTPFKTVSAEARRFPLPNAAMGGPERDTSGPSDLAGRQEAMI